MDQAARLAEARRGEYIFQPSASSAAFSDNCRQIEGPKIYSPRADLAVKRIDLRIDILCVAGCNQTKSQQQENPSRRFHPLTQSRGAELDGNRQRDKNCAQAGLKPRIQTLSAQRFPYRARMSPDGYIR